MLHSRYGCETGCCGHAVQMGDEEKFEFTHPYDQDPREFAEQLIRETFGEEHVADLDWKNSVIVDD